MAALSETGGSVFADVKWLSYLSAHNVDHI